METQYVEKQIMGKKIVPKTKTHLFLKNVNLKVSWSVQSKLFTYSRNLNM